MTPHGYSTSRPALFLLLALSCGLGCRPSSPQVPTRLKVARSEPLLVATFKVSPAGYDLVAYRTTGSPTLDVELDRAVLITARDTQGRPLASVSVENPRSAHLTESLPHQRVEFQESFLTVLLPKVDSIRELDVDVRRGPNAGFRKVYPITPAALTSITFTNLGTNVVPRGVGWTNVP